MVSNIYSNNMASYNNLHQHHRYQSPLIYHQQQGSLCPSVSSSTATSTASDAVVVEATTMGKQFHHHYDNNNSNLLAAAATAANLSTSPYQSHHLPTMMSNNSSDNYHQRHHHQHPHIHTSCLPSVTSIASQQHSSSSIINPTPQYHYRHQQQPWKLGRTSNELMLSHEIVILSSNKVPSYYHHQRNESSLSVDSTTATYHHQYDSNNMYNSLDNNGCYYSSPPPSISTSSSTTSTSIYNQGMPITNSNTKMMDIGGTATAECYNNDQYRRSSMTTSGPSSPSTSSYHEAFITRSPSPISNKRYSCRLCNKRFTRPSSLTTHIYSHTGEKPFKCEVLGCGRNFSVVSNLRRHAKIHGNQQNNPNANSSYSSSTAHSY